MSFPSPDNLPDASRSGADAEPRLLVRRSLSETAPDAGASWRYRAGAFWQKRFTDPAPTPPAPQRPLRFQWKAILRTVALCFVLAIVMVFGWALWLRHAMRANVAQTDGTLRLAGLSQPVTVTRDDHGIPSIDAANLDDLLAAQGFVTAQDRLWQMDALRRHAAGELAEILGSSLITHDRTQRILQLHAAADRVIAGMKPDQLHQLEAYARGVNAYIAAADGKLPVEFKLLHYTPQPWTPRDSILVSFAMAQDLSTIFPTKVLRESFSAHMPAALLPDLYPVGSWHDHIPGAEMPDMTSEKPAIEQVPLDETQSRLARPTASPEDLLRVRTELAPQSCADCKSGSNNWAVSGARTASGKPLVSNDMHLSLSVPDIWYTASLHTRDGSLAVAGVTLPGAPFVIVGRNQHVAWGFTNLGGDVQDVYIEHTRTSDGTAEFETSDGTWLPMGHHHERIRVRAGMDVTVDVLTTQHRIGTRTIDTPVVSSLYPTETRTLSMLWSLYDTAGYDLPFFGANTASDGASLAADFHDFNAPSLNLVYADDAGHIGYHAVGRIPVRGPAVHHPRLLSPDAPLTAPPPDDEESSITPNAPHWQQAAFHPGRRGARRNLTLRPQSPPTPALTMPATPALVLHNDAIGSPIPTTPVDALDPSAQWSEYIPFDELPSAKDPADGILATANARVTPDDYPYAVAAEWVPGYRVDRIVRSLAARTGLTADDMLALQMDVHSEQSLALAQRFAYAIDEAHIPAGDATRLHAAADILRAWKGDITVDAAAPAIVAATRGALWHLLLSNQINLHDGHKVDNPVAGIERLYSWQGAGYALELLVQHQPARWLPHGYASWNDLIAAAMTQGLRGDHAPADLHTWNLSHVHPLEISHPLLTNRALETVLGVRTGSGPRYGGGDGSTVKAVGRSFGPSERFTADLASPTASTMVLPTGEAANPLSPWFLDQLPLWLHGQTLPIDIHQNPAAHTLILRP